MPETIPEGGRDTSHKVVYGHEPWLETAFTHCHQGHDAEVLVKWGHNMQPEGLIAKDYLQAEVIAPDGARTGAAVEDGGSEHHTVKVPVSSEGFYHLVLSNREYFVLDREYQYHEGTRKEYPEAAHAILYLQFAQVFIAAGHDLQGVPPRAETQLELVPATWQPWRVGDTIPLQAYFRGQPLDVTILDLACQGPEGYRQWKETADGGILNFQPQAAGRYLAITRREVQEGLAGEYDSISLTATLSFMVLKA
jgi:uncharacterized GH25 family protein